MLRKTLLATALTLFAIPALAAGPQNQNIGTVTNAAVGHGNTAVQSVTGIQSGGYAAKHGYGYQKHGYGSQMNSNLGHVSNLAAGTKNTAVQDVTGIQELPSYNGYGKGHGKGYDKGYGKSYGSMNQNLGSASNAAVGSHNFAGQKVIAVQRQAPYGGYNSNIGHVDNLAAGVGNTALQSVTGIQR